MSIVTKTISAQFGLKEQCVLVPAELKFFLQRSCDEEYLISLGLVCWLTDKSVVNKQEIRPALVNSALQKLSKINPFYSNFTIDNEWKDLSEQSGLMLWNIWLTRMPESLIAVIRLIVMMIKMAMPNLKKDNWKGLLHFFQLSCILLMDQTYLPVKLIIPGEGQIPTSFTSEPNWKH